MQRDLEILYRGDASELPPSMVACLDAHRLRRLDNQHRGRPLEKLDQQRLVRRVQVLDHDIGQTTIGWNVGKKLLQHLQAASRSPQADDACHGCSFDAFEAEMMKLARNLEFEQAARLRDQIQKLRQVAFGLPSARAG